MHPSCEAGAVFIDVAHVALVVARPFGPLHVEFLRTVIEPFVGHQALGFDGGNCGRRVRPGAGREHFLQLPEHLCHFLFHELHVGPGVLTPARSGLLPGIGVAPAFLRFILVFLFHVGEDFEHLLRTHRIFLLTTRVDIGYGLLEQIQHGAEFLRLATDQFALLQQRSVPVETGSGHQSLDFLERKFQRAVEQDLLQALQIAVSIQPITRPRCGPKALTDRSRRNAATGGC